MVRVGAAGGRAWAIGEEQKIMRGGSPDATDIEPPEVNIGDRVRQVGA